MADIGERLGDLLSYDPDTGHFRWKVKRKKIDPGDVAGSVVSKRYRMIQIDGVHYLAHRLAWLFVHGRWPKQIDHINRNPFDNRIANLREASPAENARNRRGRRDSKSGVKGVCFRPRSNNWEANIMVDGIAIYLGRYPTLQQAAAIYTKAAQDLHREFAGGLQS